MPVLIFEYCRTEEQSDGPEIASVARLTKDRKDIYVTVIAGSWREMLHGASKARLAYVEEFMNHFATATQAELEHLFNAGAQVSSGPLRGRVVDSRP